MIFATCGSSHFPFERMMTALAELPASDLHVQHGPAIPPPCAWARRYMPFGEVGEQMDLADLVVTHAGVGSILSAVRAGHRPIVFPRLKRYGECVDDHQAELAEVLQERHTVVIVRTSAELIEAIGSVPSRGSSPKSSSQPLIDAVHASIVGIPLGAVPIDG